MSSKDEKKKKFGGAHMDEIHAMVEAKTKEFVQKHLDNYHYNIEPEPDSMSVNDE